MPTETLTPHVTRRRLLGSITTGILTAIGGILGVLGGGAVLSSTVRRQEDWLAASALHDLPDNQPTPVTLTVMRMDGYREALERRTIFLVKTGESEVAAFDARCTHLGCLVRWDLDGQAFRCPCHGGVFDRTGAVMDGPPPEPLAKIATRVDGNRVMVQA
ncbi:MAG: Rieske (2Fe-2S) protein [Acidobacteria bacterium]|nr:Rieske (2Fe-2S) protein [Acidobacteriota bacterium]